MEKSSISAGGERERLLGSSAGKSARTSTESDNVDRFGVEGKGGRSGSLRRGQRCWSNGKGSSLGKVHSPASKNVHGISSATKRDS